LGSLAEFLVVDDELHRSDAIVVLGSGSRNRLSYGVKLYRSGYGKKIIITGMVIQLPGIATTWPRLARSEALSMGVSEQAIVLEERPTSTYEDAKYVKEDMVKDNLESAIVVSSPYHTRRSKMIFKKVFSDRKDIRLLFSPSDSEEFETKKWWVREHELVAVVSEYFKLVIYIFKYII